MRPLSLLPPIVYLTRSAFAFACSLALLSTTSTPLEAQGRLRGTARVGADFGGDPVLEFQYSDGSTPEVTAGGGVLFTAGGVYEAYRARGHRIDAQLSVGVKYRTIPPATNQEATWLRFPVEALAFYGSPSGLRLGAGPTVHLGNSLETSGMANGNVEFRAKPGMLLQAEFVRKTFAFDVRYTALTYESASNGETLDASSIGAGMSIFFGRRTPAVPPAQGSASQ